MTLRTRGTARIAARIAIVAMLGTTLVATQAAPARAIPPACSNPSLAAVCDELNDLVAELVDPTAIEMVEGAVETARERIARVLPTLIGDVEPRELTAAIMDYLDAATELAVACATRSYSVCDTAYSLIIGLVDAAVILAEQCAGGDNVTCNEAKQLVLDLVNVAVRYAQTCLGGTNGVCNKATETATAVLAAAVALAHTAEVLAADVVSGAPGTVAAIEQQVLGLEQDGVTLARQALSQVPPPSTGTLLATLNEVVASAQGLVATAVGLVSGGAGGLPAGLNNLIQQIPLGESPKSHAYGAPIPQLNVISDAPDVCPSGTTCDFATTVSDSPLLPTAVAVPLPEQALSLSTGLSSGGFLGFDEALHPSDTQDLLDVGESTGISSLFQTVSTNAYDDNYAMMTRIPDTKKAPARMTALIGLEFPNGTAGSCTGFMLSHNVVGTAGHCLYQKAWGGWASQAWIAPGNNGLADAPYGECGKRNLISVRGWVKDQKPSYDYGAIVLNCDIGLKTGYVGLLTKTSVSGQKARINGYPHHDPYNNPSYYQYGAVGPLSDPDDKKQIYHRIRTTDGVSGAPIMQAGCGGYCAIGLHSGVIGYFTKHNTGPRITDSVYKNYQDWIRSYGNLYYV